MLERGQKNSQKRKINQVRQCRRNITYNKLLFTSGAAYESLYQSTTNSSEMSSATAFGPNSSFGVGLGALRALSSSVGYKSVGLAKLSAQLLQA